MISSVLDFSEVERDCLIELCNIAVGRAAASLSVMVDQEVTLTIPDFDIIPHAQAVSFIAERTQGPVCVVNSSFAGQLSGDLYLMFPRDDGMRLVRRLLRDAPPLADLTELERDALLEVGNIILNAFLGELGNMMAVRFDCGLPDLKVGPAVSVLRPRGEGDVVLLFRISFGLTAEAIGGYLVVMAGAASADLFKALSHQIAQRFGMTAE